NFILAFVLSLAVISVLGYDPAIITGVNKDSAAYQAGLREGDKIVKINNRRIHVSREASSYFLFSPLSDEEVKITYERDGKEDTAMLTPQYKENYILGFTYMPDSSPATIESLYEGYPMDKAGLMPGDIIIGFNGSRIESGEQLTNYLYQNPLDKSQVELEFLRDGKEQVVEVTPEYAGEGYELGYTIRYGYVDASPLEVIKYSLVEIKYNISVAIRSFGMLITGRAGANDIAGPVGIVNIIGDTYEASKAGGGLIVFINLASLTIMLSANVGVINLFPLPALDGGRLVFLFLELIRRKPIPAEKEGMVHFVGIMALMFLMVFVLFNDIRKILPF
ncbi:MAG: RIP metalloprotease RseP, partial [Clostridiales bacterium]|nr:RIP metalloprotease RseP [Clostridiales bacterium]